MIQNRLVVMTLCLIFSTTFFAPCVHAASGGIKWYGFHEGMALGRKENKKVYIHFWASWCSYCKKMETDTFSNTSVIAYLNRNFISIKVDADREKDISSEFRVSGLPDNWFLDENGQKISNRSGYMAPALFLSILKFIRTDSYKQKSFRTFLEEM